MKPEPKSLQLLDRNLLYNIDSLIDSFIKSPSSLKRSGIEVSKQDGDSESPYQEMKSDLSLFEFD